LNTTTVTSIGESKICVFVEHHLLGPLLIEAARPGTDQRESDGLKAVVGGDRHHIPHGIPDRPL
jgi:hypothetical protein